jgi:hypothetical protein
VGVSYECIQYIHTPVVQGIHLAFPEQLGPSLSCVLLQCNCNAREGGMPSFMGVGRHAFGIGNSTSDATVRRDSDLQCCASHEEGSNGGVQNPS